MSKTQKRSISTFLVIMLTLVFNYAFFAACGGDTDTLEITATNNVTRVDAGTSVQFTAQFNGANTTSAIFVLEEGDDYGQISASGYLTVKTTTPAESVIKVKAVQGDVVSNVYTITVNVILTTLAFTNDLHRMVELSEVITLNVTHAPANASVTGVTYTKTSDPNNAATLNGNVLTISSDAGKAGSVIKVKASLGEVATEEFEFEVVGEKIRNYSTGFSSELYTADKFDTATNLDFRVRDAVTNQPVTTESVRYTIESGVGLITINDATGEVTVLGDGLVEVKAELVGVRTPTGGIYSDVTMVDAIMPPTSIDFISFTSTLTLPNAVTPEYSIGNANTATIDYKVNKAPGTTVCENVVFSAEKVTGAFEGDIVESITANTIKFKAGFTGTAKIIITPNSGSVADESLAEEVTVKVNNGVNVTTFAEFKAAMTSAKTYRIANLMNNLLDTSSSYSEVADLQVDIRSNDVQIYGNGYTFNFEGQAPGAGFNWGYGSSFININQPLPDTGGVGFTLPEWNRRVNVVLRDFAMIGLMHFKNTPAGTDVNGSHGSGVTDSKNFFNSAIRIRHGNANFIDIKNIKMEGWNDSALGIYNGVGTNSAGGQDDLGIIENCEFSNNWNNHIQLSDSRIEIKDCTFSEAGREAIAMDYKINDWNGVGENPYAPIERNKHIPSSGINMNGKPFVYFSGNNVVENYQIFDNPTSLSTAGTGVGNIIQSGLMAGLAATFRDSSVQAALTSAGLGSLLDNTDDQKNLLSPIVSADSRLNLLISVLTADSDWNNFVVFETGGKSDSQAPYAGVNLPTTLGQIVENGFPTYNKYISLNLSELDQSYPYAIFALNLRA